MPNPATTKAARVFNRLTNRYDRPGSTVRDLTVSNTAENITLEVHFDNGAHLQHDLDPTRGVLDLSRQAQALINQHVNAQTGH
jgi:hypothetical protein